MADLGLCGVMVVSWQGRMASSVNWWHFVKAALQHLVDEVVTEVSSLSVGVVCGEVGTDWGWGATDKKWPNQELLSLGRIIHQKAHNINNYQTLHRYAVNTDERREGNEMVCYLPLVAKYCVENYSKWLHINI